MHIGRRRAIVPGTVVTPPRVLQRWLLLLPLLAVVVALSSPANAVPGALDLSFGVDGWAVTQLGALWWAHGAVAAIQPDGRIVVAGTASRGFAVVRYLPDGTPDTSFGDDGIVKTPFEETPSGALAITLQPDGKLVVAGYAGGRPYNRSVRMAVARYRADGSLDPDFGGGDGKLVVPSLTAVAFATHVAADGRIFLGGCGHCYERGQTVELVALTPGGAVDTDFRMDRRITVSTRGGIDAFTFDDKGIVAMTWAAGHMKLIRFDLDGSLDASFGGDGIRRYPLGGYLQLRATMDANGRIVILAGRYIYRSSLVIRLTRTGRLDTSFSDDGVASVGVALEHVCAVRTDGDGNVLIGGGIWVGGGSGEDHSVLARFTEDGTADIPFGVQGIVEQPGPVDMDLTDGCDDLAFQPDGNVVLVISSISGHPRRPIMLARFLAD